MAVRLSRKFVLFGSCLGSAFQIQSGLLVKGNPTIFPVYYASQTASKVNSRQTRQPSGSLQLHKTGPRTKSPSKKALLEKEHGTMVCIAYSTGERYNLQALRKYFENSSEKYTISAMPQDASDVLHVCMKDRSGEEQGEIYFFRWLGSLVFWNVSHAEIQHIKSAVKPWQEGVPYDDDLVETEDEQLLFSYTKNPTSLVKGKILLCENTKEETTHALEKYAFSNAMALSVKLAIWESVLDDYVESIRWVPETLKRGFKVHMSRKEVLEKTGELISLRYKINLSSDLLMTPDFYWDREDLAELYDLTCSYLDISRRTKVMNEKLNHCSEMAELLRTHLSEQHSFRLEWGIIALITIEVVFEILHLAERYFPPS